MSFDELAQHVEGWANEKGLLKADNASKQMLKVLEEVGETSGALLRNDRDGIKDGIGDTISIISK